MKEYKVKPIDLEKFKRYKTDNWEAAVKGQLYELYCYNELIQRYSDIQIIKANYVDRKSKGNFRYSNDGKVIFYTEDKPLAEFDAIGFKEKCLYWWEITRGKFLEKKSIAKKMYLIHRLFSKYEIHFTLIMPKPYTGLKGYNFEVIKEPDYEPYIEKGYFKFNKIISKCAHISLLNDQATDFNFIKDLIKVSRAFYLSGKSREMLKKIKKNLFITRLYDIEKVSLLKFNYYDVTDDTEGFIEMKNSMLFVDQNGNKIDGKHKYEVLSIMSSLAKRK